jgi:hypothetical protein
LEAFRVGAWTALISKFNILVSETIVAETLWYTDSRGVKKPIDLAHYIKNKQIQSFDISMKDLKHFVGKYDPAYQDRLDLGELSLLCYLFQQDGSNMLICSGDAIVFKILGKARKSAQGVSLEELLSSIGHAKPVSHQFRKKFKERHGQSGFSDSFS